MSKQISNGVKEIINSFEKSLQTYDEETAEEVYLRLPQYLGIFQSLRDKLVQFSKEE